MLYATGIPGVWHLVILTKKLEETILSFDPKQRKPENRSCSINICLRPMRIDVWLSRDKLIKSSKVVGRRNTDQSVTCLDCLLRQSQSVDGEAKPLVLEKLVRHLLQTKLLDKKVYVKYLPLWPTKRIWSIFSSDSSACCCINRMNALATMGKGSASFTIAFVI